MKARLSWNDENYGVQGFNVYRDTQPLDPQNLPAPLASLGPAARDYEDATVVDQTTYYYMVTALVDGQEPATANFEILAEEPDEVPTYEVFEATGTGATGTIQQWTAPNTGLFTIEAYGAQGGGTVGGLGAKIVGTFDLTQGDVLEVGVGQHGVPLGSGNGSGDNNGSGGGGSFVRDANGDPLVVAGGGGGGMDAGYSLRHGQATDTVGDGTTSDGNGAWGGAGWDTPGSGNAEPLGGSALGCTEGTYNEGGFGGGGSTSSQGSNSRVGGGGGYVGGGGANAGGNQSGAGGGSYNAGTDQDNQAGVNEGDGRVVIHNESGSALAPA